MFIGSKKYSKKKKPTISDFNKYLINTLENKPQSDNINKSLCQAYFCIFPKKGDTKRIFVI